MENARVRDRAYTFAPAKKTVPPRLLARADEVIE
jgi:hypothetical protein